MTALARPLDAGFSGARPRGSRTQKRLGLSAAAIFGIATALVLAVGLVLPTEHYITPQRGVGYWLGIIGGSMMLLLFLWLGAITGIERTGERGHDLPALVWIRHSAVCRSIRGHRRRRLARNCAT